MKILGIGFLSESSVALINNGTLEYAISQERLNRVKNWWGNPFDAIDFVLKETNTKIKDIDYFVTHGLSALKKDIPDKSHFLKKINEVKNSSLNEKLKKKQIFYLNKRFKHEVRANNRVLRNINSLKKKFNNVEVYDHHHAHAASAYYYSKWKNCYVLTIDGWGDNSSSKLYRGKDGELIQLSKSHTIDSLGYFYGSITKLLGFKPHRHEGKILGLAAYGNPNKAYKIISKMISYDKKTKSFKGHFEKGIYLSTFKNKNLTFLKKKFTPKDIAAATQKRLEVIILDFIKDNIPNGSKIALAGGVFANVKINQKISELKNISEIYVFPNMGDGGLSVGCAALSYFRHSKKFPKKIKDVYLGPSFKDRDIIIDLKKSKLNFKKIKNSEKFLAKKLNEGFVVGNFQGRMEFGPRALGNRSILVKATDKKVNDWLNKRLKRTEFMPFAPITLQKYAKKMYENLDSKKLAIKFMTTTVKCTSKAIKMSPAAVHVDKTARPQIVSKETNKKLYKIINEYLKLSKIPNLINTSFNVHEEPIVCKPSDAFRAFKSSNLDYLYIGSYIVYKK